MIAADRAAILRACQTLGAQGQVLELRALDAVTPGWRRPHTVAGYFDDWAKLAAAAAQLQARGVYITLNPVQPALLARAHNRVKDLAVGDSVTGDADIVARRWLPVDCDPVRRTGISATDAEHDLALARARAVRETLREQGWPEPVLADSGNGGHLLYRIDLPAADGGLVGRVLRALAFLFEDEQVILDQMVANPARIWKLYGTVARKGDDLPERPHRLARLLEAPETLVPVPSELLEALAAAPPAEPMAAARPFAASASRGEFDLTGWIAEHGLAVEGPRTWGSQGGERWIFPVCPWNAAHRRSAYIVRFPSGALAAGCHHSSCRAHDWHALRDLVEPHRSQVRPGSFEVTGCRANIQPESANAPWSTCYFEPFVRLRAGSSTFNPARRYPRRAGDVGSSDGQDDTGTGRGARADPGGPLHRTEQDRSAASRRGAAEPGLPGRVHPPLAGGCHLGGAGRSAGAGCDGC